MSGLLNIPTKARGLSLRAKMLILIGSMLIILIALPYALTQTILVHSFADLEDKDIHRNTQRVLNVLSSDQETLQTYAYDWAHWDDTYRFMQDRDPAFIDANFDDTSFIKLRLNFAGLLDTSDQLVYGKAFNLENRLAIPISPQSFADYLSREPMAHYADYALDGVVGGLAITPCGPTLLVTQQILTSHEQGPSRGSLIFARCLNATEISRMAASTRLVVDFKYFDDPKLPDDFKKALKLFESRPGIVNFALDSNTLAGYSLVNDISGRPALVLRVESPRDIYREGQNTIFYFLLIFLAAGLLLTAAMILLINRVVLSRLLRMDESVRRIGQSGDMGVRVPVKGQDELSSLAQSINGMLDAMQRSQSTLAEKELRLQRIITSISDVIYTAELDPKGQIIRHKILSPQMNTLTGYPISRFEEDFEFWQTLILPEDWPPAYKHMEQLRAGQGREIEYRVRRADGQVIWVRDSVHVAVTPAGQGGTAYTLYGVISDFTARKQIEDALRQAHEQLEQRVQERVHAEQALAAERNLLRTLIDHVPDRIYVKDIEGRKLLCNRAEAEAMGLSDPVEVVGKRDSDLYPPDLAAGYAEDDRAVMQSGLPLIDHEELALIDGCNECWILTTKVPLHDAQGKIVGLVGIGRDITARKLVEQELQTSQQRLELALQAAEAGLWDWNMQTDDVVFNQRWAEMLGYTLEEVGTKTGLWEDSLHPDDQERVQAVLNRHLEAKIPLYECEYRLRTKTGDWKWILDRGKVVRRDDEGHPLRMIGTHLDITPRRNAEAERERMLRQVRTRTIELAAVAEISRQITTILDIDPLLWAVCQLIKDEFDLYHVHIYLFDPQDQMLKLVAGQGEVGRQLVDRQHHIPIQHTASVVARAARTRESVVISNVKQSPDFLPNPLLPDTRAEMAIPMLLGDDLIGVLDIQSDTFDRFTTEDVNIQTTLAAQVAIAIHNARLFTEGKQAEEALAKAQALLLSAVTQTPAGIVMAEGPTVHIRVANSAAAEILGQPVDELNQLDLTKPEVITSQSFFPDRTPYALDNLPLARAVRYGESTQNVEMIIRQGSGEERWILTNAAPVRNAKGEVIAGVVVFVDITERRQNEEALRRANRAYRALSDSNQAMVRASNESQLLEDICRTIVEAGGYRMAWVAYAEGDPVQSLSLVSQAGYDAGYIQTILPTLLEAAGPTATALKTGAPCLIRDTATDPIFAPWRDEALERGYRSVIALPLVVEGQPLGILNVYGAEPHAFDMAEINLLTELANDLAFGITAQRLNSKRRYAEEQLRQSEANLFALIENTNDSIWSVDTGHRIITMNSTMKQVFRQSYGVELEPGMVGTTFMPPEEQVERQTLYNRALAGERFRVEKHYDYEAAPPVEVEISFNPIVGPEGKVTGVSAFSRDITGRKQAEEQLRQLNARLGKRNQELSTLYETGRSLTGMLDIREIYRAMYEGIAWRLLNAPNFLIALYDEPNQLITCDFAVVDHREVDLAQFAPMPLGSGPNSEAIRTRQPQIVELPDDHHGRYVHIESDNPEDPRSALFVPLISGNQVIGVLNVQHYDPHAFQDTDLTLVSTFANQAATAIQNARLFAAEREQHQLAEALRDMATAITRTLDSRIVIERILDNLQPVIPHSAANIMLLEEGYVHVVGHRGYTQRGLEEWVKRINVPLSLMTTLHQMFDDGLPVVISDIGRDFPGWALAPEAQWVKSYAGAPIQLEGRVIGFLNIYSDELGFFTNAQSDRLQAFADQAAIAIRNAQLFTAEHEQRALSEALSSVAATLNQTLDPDVVMDRLLMHIQSVVPHDAASIMLIDEENRAYIVRHTGFVERGQSDAVSNLRFPVDEMPKFTRMAAEGRPVYIAETHESPEWTYVPGLEWIHAYIGAPIKYGDKLIGLLNLDSATPGFFDDKHADRLQAFADQAAIAIQNAQLFAAEREQRLFAETVRDIAATINRTLELDTVLDDILMYIKRVVPHDAANVMLIEGKVARLVRESGYTERGLGEWAKNLNFVIDEQGLMAQVIDTRQPVIISFTGTDPRWVRFPETDWILSYACVPIRQGDTVIGFLNVYSDKPYFFSPAHTERLQAFSDQVANAIRNARLFADERDQRTLAEALRDTAAAINQSLDLDDVLDLVLENTGRVVPHDAANIMLIEEGIARVVRGKGYAEHGVGDWVSHLRYVVAEIPIWRKMLETGQPFAIPDTALEPGWLNVPEEAWIRSTVKAPIRIEDRIVGILHLDSTIPGAFSQEHADRLQAFADQAAIALRNAQLFADERDQHTLAEALRDTAAAINRTLDFDQVADAILNNVGRVAPYDVANLMLVEDGVARIVRTVPPPQGDTGWLDDLRFVLAETRSMKIMVETGKPVVIPDVHDYEGWIPVPETAWIRSHASAPIQRDGQVIGFLVLDAAAPGFFTSEHVTRLQTFSDQAAIAIHNAQLFADVRTYATRMGQLVEERTLELEQRRAQLQAILDSIGEGVIYNENLRTRYTNRALTQLTGYASEEFTGYLELLRTSKQSQDVFNTLVRRIFDSVERMGLWHGELRLRRKDGSEFDAALVVTPARGISGQVMGVVTVIRDISQEKALREQKDRFIASASHELRTPLANFKTRLYLLGKQPEKFDQHMATLNRVTNGMNELVENLLDVSRFERGVIPMHPRSVALQDIVNDVVTIQVAEAERKGLTLTSVLYPTPLVVYADPQRLAQVITNLISNAINYTPPEGHITVELVPDDEQTPRRALMRVRDSGIGIAPEMLSQVFDPFFRGNEEVGTGAGLGLTIAKEIIKLHEGQLSVESEVGKGSVFTVALDLVRE